MSHGNAEPWTGCCPAFQVPRLPASKRPVRAGVVLHRCPIRAAAAATPPSGWATTRPSASPASLAFGRFPGLRQRGSSASMPGSGRAKTWCSSSLPSSTPIARALREHARHILHDLKSSVISPLRHGGGSRHAVRARPVRQNTPLGCNHWRSRIGADKPVTRLLVDKLTREQADSIIHTLQRTA